MINFVLLFYSTTIESLLLSVQVSTNNPRSERSLDNETISMSFNIGMVWLYVWMKLEYHAIYTYFAVTCMHK